MFWPGSGKEPGLAERYIVVMFLKRSIWDIGQELVGWGVDSFPGRLVSRKKVLGSPGKKF